MLFEEFNAMKEACRIMWLYEQIKHNYISCTRFMKKVEENNGKYPDDSPDYIYADYEYRDKWEKEHGSECPFKSGELLVALIDMETEKVVLESRKLEHPHLPYSVRIGEWILDGENGEKYSVVGGLEVRNDNKEDSMFCFPFVDGFDFMESDNGGVN